MDAISSLTATARAIRKFYLSGVYTADTVEYGTCRLRGYGLFESESNCHSRKYKKLQLFQF